ncbi:hypothetical protein PHLCEN_2v10761 [Hermanssonia centrifuga]|uniref:Uncharacterized protein n=1 Tax=Hermanssonia centrifuga TaxID=98765 RepID=A0A2R6NMA0_9APHY|nr:hypothetical protein PHLCEN_2v10761 [Hermanssonia centrifuga]
MPICGFSSNSDGMSTDPQMRQVEKRIAEEERLDQKNLDHSIKDLKNAENMHQRAMKSADKAQHNLDKAVAQEHKAATALNQAQHKHDAAIADEQTGEKTLDLKRQHQARLEKDLQQRRATMEDFQHRKDINDQNRELKLSEVHADAASRAGSRVNSISRGQNSINRGQPNAPGDVNVGNGTVGPQSKEAYTAQGPNMVSSGGAGPDTGPTV